MSTAKEIHANRKRDTTHTNPTWAQDAGEQRCFDSFWNTWGSFPRLSGAGSDLELKQSRVPSGVLVALSYPD